MCKILLSINPEHVENILSGKKTYEFRKVKCREKIDKIVIYSTFPVMKIVAEADVEDVLIDNPESIWKITSNEAGISKDFYDSYYENKDLAIAFKLGSIKKYENPKKLSAFGLKTAPQSFVYLQSEV